MIWSNALAYHEVNLAPRDRHEELEQIGEAIAGEGPTLMTEYEPYGVRHFLRKGDPEGASELRRRPVLLRSGRQLDKLEPADVDELADASLLVYRTLVLRRSPVASRPPSIYTRVRSGRYYDVWQRAPGSERTLLQHLPLGFGPTSPPPRPLATTCGGSRASPAPRVGRLAVAQAARCRACRAGSAGRLAVASRTRAHRER